MMPWSLILIKNDENHRPIQHQAWFVRLRLWWCCTEEIASLLQPRKLDLVDRYLQNRGRMIFTRIRNLEIEIMLERKYFTSPELNYSIFRILRFENMGIFPKIFRKSPIFISHCFSKSSLLQMLFQKQYSTVFPGKSVKYQPIKSKKALFFASDWLKYETLLRIYRTL